MQQPKYYKSIVDLSLNRFIDCLVDQNIYALVITGKPAEVDLKSAWDDILLEYNFHMMDEEGKFHFNLLKEFELLKLDYQKVEMCLQILNIEINYPEVVAPEKRFADDLNNLTQANFKFDHSKPEEFKSDLKRAQAKSKLLLLKIQVKQANLDAVNTKNNTKVDKVTKEYFQSILNTLSIGIANFQLTEAMTVFSFCDWVKKYNAKQKFLESQTIKK